MTDKKEVEKAVYLPTTAAVDLELRMDKEEMTKEEYEEKYPEQVNGRDFSGECDTSAYVGVSPEYMNYASVGEKPFSAGEDSALGRLEKQLKSGSAVAEAGPGPESNPTDGGGSKVPVVYASFSGEDFENRVVTAKEAKAEGDRLAPKDSETLKPVAPASAPVAKTAPSAPSKTSSK